MKKIHQKFVIVSMAAMLMAVPLPTFADNIEHELGGQLITASSYQLYLDKKIEVETKDLEESLDKMDAISKVANFPSQNLCEVSQTEFNILSRIVEAEATDKDMKSKILVANVILNRLKSKEFPDSIESIVFQRENGAVQFSPTADGRYYSVHVTESSRESAKRALGGEDYSKGALYFVERDIADPSNVSWFDRALTKLFEYQGHAFYK